LLTLHAAKGLEFNQVFITGLDECLLPHSRSFDEPEEMAEERRLFYVGMTRTRQQLYLVRAEQRFNYGAPSYSQPSRFLTDIQENLLQHDSSGRSVRFTTENTAWQQPERWTSSTRWPGSTGSHPGVSDSERQAPPMHAKPVRGKSKTDSSWKVQRRPAADVAPSHKPAPRPAAQPKAEPKFKAGMKVRHEKLGPGEVRQSIVDANGEEVVTVYFSEQEREIKILTSFAKLDMVK
jgi:DNA helicase-2/ATP-dependent DNA helicase PcrA